MIHIFHQTYSYSSFHPTSSNGLGPGHVPFSRMGNRDINKMRLTSEYTDQELALLSPESPAAYWVPEARLAYEGHYRRVELLSLCNKEREIYIYLFIYIIL